MKKAKKEKFDKWYEENKNNHFYLREKLYEYGTNDTDILFLAVCKFRKLLIEMTKEEGKGIR